MEHKPLTRNTIIKLSQIIYDGAEVPNGSVTPNGEKIKQGDEWKYNPVENRGDSTEKDQHGASIEKVSNVTNIQDEEFITPSHSYLLPAINEKFAEAINKKNKRVLLTKHTIERMLRDHKEMLDGKNRKRILNNALNNFTDVLFCRPNYRPNYYTFVKNGKHYDMSVIDTDKNKKYFEVVDWRRIDEEGYKQMISKMEREDGQFLITDGRTSTGRLTFPLFRSSIGIIM